MADSRYVTKDVPIPFKGFGGGLNTESGPLGVASNESTKLMNVDFDKFGSVAQRGGYISLNLAAMTGSLSSDWLYWFEYEVANSKIRSAIQVISGNVMSMDDLKGSWDYLTGSIAQTSVNLTDFMTFQNNLVGTNNFDPPWYWDPTSANCATLSSGIEAAKTVVEYNNYSILGNVKTGGIRYPDRIYWSTIRTIDEWSSADFTPVGEGDGQQITRLWVLGDRLVIFKERSIYIAMFTGERDAPFVFPQGGKTNSNVGCVAPFSIQEIDNGLVFLSYDGLYYFDGFNSYKISDRINDTINGLNKNKLDRIVSMYQKTKNRYYMGCTDSGASSNNICVIWDSFNNSFSLYNSFNASAMAVFNVSGTNERPYFCDHAGWSYRCDTNKKNDFPSNAKTAISAYYYTNWRPYEDILDKKGIPHATIYYQKSDSVLDFIYAYDFDSSDWRTQTVNIVSEGGVWGEGLWDVMVWGGSGSGVIRRDMEGQGRVVRFGFKNHLQDETFRIDGLGEQVRAQTYV